MTPQTNTLLNTIFLLLALAAVIVFFMSPQDRSLFYLIGGLALILRIIHYILKFVYK